MTWKPWRILIYTAAPDSEGTLGGLVALGEMANLEQHLDQALEGLEICSSDPCAPRRSRNRHSCRCTGPRATTACFCRKPRASGATAISTGRCWCRRWSARRLLSSSDSDSGASAKVGFVRIDVVHAVSA